MATFQDSSPGGTRPAPSGPPGRESSRMPPWLPRAALLAVVSAFGAYAAFALLRRIQHLILWLLIALFLSFALEPAVNWLARRGWRRGLATGLVLFGLAFLFLAMVGLMVPLVVDQVRELVTQVPRWLDRVSIYTERWLGFELTGERILRQVGSAEEAVGRIAANIASVGALLLGLLFQLLTIGLFAFYLVADGPRVRRAVCSLLPPRRQREVLAVWELAIDKTGGFLYSRLLLAVISALAAFVVLSVLRVPFAVPLALWLGLVSQFIPVIGTYIAAAVPLLVALLSNPWSAAIFLAYVFGYQQLENYLLAPRITARTMRLHPAVAFFAALAGASLSGVVGAFLALPAAAIIQATVSTYVTRHEVLDTELTRDAAEPPAGRATAAPREPAEPSARPPRRFRLLARFGR